MAETLQVEALDILRAANQVLFVLLAVLCLALWRRHGGSAAGWLSAAFGVLAMAAVAGLLLPRSGDGLWLSMLIRLLIAAVLLFPYLLCRFAGSLEPFSRRTTAMIGWPTALVTGSVFLLPPLPQPGDPRPWWVSVFVSAALAQWTVLTAVVALRWWGAGAGQPAAVRVRVRGLSLASVGLNAGVIVSGVSTPDNLALGLASAMFGTVSAVLFYVAFSPPALLREVWRRPAQAALFRAMGEFISAHEVEHVYASALPHVTAILGARGAAVVDAAGHTLCAHGQTTPPGGAESPSGGNSPQTLREAAPVRVALADGALLVWVSPYAPLFGQQELQVLETLGTLADLARQRIAARKAVNERLRRSELFLDSVVENLPDMIVVKRASDLRLVRVNRAAERMLGCARDDVIEGTHGGPAPAEQAHSALRELRLLASADEEEFEERLDAGDGADESIERTLHVRQLLLPGADGRPEYLLAICRDVTEAKTAEAALRRAREEADRANQAKSEFLSRMSHELRTPLNAVLGFAQLLEMEANDDQREFAHQIRRGGSHLLDLINEVLDVARIESGQLPLSPEPVLVADVLDEAMELIRPLASERGLTLAPTSAAGCRAHVVADRQRIKQVMLNLLSNAVKYNRVGGRIDVFCDPAGAEDGPRLRISVRDTGIGISEADLHRLFTPFERLGAEGTDVEGTGVGLALSLRLVEAMGGQLTVRSALGVGSEFTVTLKLADVAAPAPLVPVAALAGRLSENGNTDTDAPPRGFSRTLLSIEDNSSNVRLLEQLVSRRAGWRLVHASQGRVGLDLASSLLAGGGVDLLLLDLHLPDMHGYDVLRHLRSHPATASVPVVVLSADASPGQIQRLLSAGANRYLTKPFDATELLDILDTITAGRPVDEGAEDAAPSIR